MIQFFIFYGTINRGKSCILTPPITTFNFVQLHRTNIKICINKTSKSQFSKQTDKIESKNENKKKNGEHKEDFLRSRNKIYMYIYISIKHKKS